MSGPAAGARFPIDAVRARPGCLAAEITSNSATRTGPRLLHRLTVPLEPLRIDDRLTEAELFFESVVLDVRSWRELGGRQFSFLSRPVTGFQDGDPIPVGPMMTGTLRLSGRAHPAYGVELDFGSADGVLLPSTITLVVDFDAESAAYEPAELTLDVPLEVGGLSVIGDIGAPERPSADEAIELARQVVDVDDYDFTTIDGVVVLHPAPRRTS